MDGYSSAKVILKKLLILQKVSENDLVLMYNYRTSVQKLKTEEIVEGNFEVHGYPVSQHPYNPMFDVQKQLPIYSKTPKSKSLFCAGYYIICFEKGWRKAYCPKLITLQRYPFKGPIRSKIEMQQVLNNAIKEQNTNTSN
jgi:hypothetical protein